MNTPKFDGGLSPPDLPPLSSHPAPGTAPAIALDDPDLSHRWQGGYGALEQDADEPFLRTCDPTPVESPQFLAISPQACELIGTTPDRLAQSQAWLAILSGNASPKHFQPYASVYAGHQFGVFVPRLGDGRALNIGALQGWELQLKGAGPTPYARFADGRAVLRSSIREFLCSEAMHALGIPSTRALSLAISPSVVIRESLETAAIVCRMAPSFIRFGTFEYFGSRGRSDLNLRLLRHVAPMLGVDPALESSTLATNVLQETARRTAILMAQWMSVGFMHGVMNTDNFSILGFTLDYGPYGFMDGYDRNHICNHTDYHGRYRYEAQPQVGLWNLWQLSQTLHALVAHESVWPQIHQIYGETYSTTAQRLLRRKLGLPSLEDSLWSSLLDGFYTLLETQHPDYTLIFRALANSSDTVFLDLMVDRDAATPWLAQYREAAQQECWRAKITETERQNAMNRVNPKYVLRNWIAESVIREVRDEHKSALFDRVFRVLRTPFEDHPEHEDLAKPPPQWAQHLSVSCSS